MPTDTEGTIEAFTKRLLAFYDLSDARLWLNTPHPCLGDERAIDLIRAGRADEVDAHLHALETGAYL